MAEPEWFFIFFIFFACFSSWGRNRESSTTPVVLCVVLHGGWDQRSVESVGERLQRRCELVVRMNWTWTSLKFNFLTFCSQKDSKLQNEPLEIFYLVADCNVYDRAMKECHKSLWRFQISFNKHCVSSYFTQLVYKRGAPKQNSIWTGLARFLFLLPPLYCQSFFEMWSSQLVGFLQNILDEHLWVWSTWLGLLMTTYSLVITGKNL